MSANQPHISTETLERVMESFECLEGVSASELRKANGGLINETFVVGERAVLQRLHPIFGGPVNEDIHALGTIARERGVTLPEVLPTREGKLWVECEGVWRVLSFLPGRTLHQLENADQARSAGRLVGDFHRAFSGVNHSFHFSRGRFHDTSARMRELEDALDRHREHRLHGEVSEVGRQILSLWSQVQTPTSLPKRICHGDLKVSNLRFSEGANDALSLLDLDTITYGTLDAELGDAFRSWCNQAPEHAAEPRWELELFAQGWGGFKESAGSQITPEECASIVPGTLRIILELSARFGADALNESYFGYDPMVASTRGEHNLLRARSQLALAKIVQDNRGVMEEIVRL